MYFVGIKKLWESLVPLGSLRFDKGSDAFVGVPKLLKIVVPHGFTKEP